MSYRCDVVCMWCIVFAARLPWPEPGFNSAQGYRWDLVAKRLGTGRTPFQCFARYQQEVKKLYVVAADIARGSAQQTHTGARSPVGCCCAQNSHLAVDGGRRRYSS